MIVIVATTKTRTMKAARYKTFVLTNVSSVQFKLFKYEIAIENDVRF